MVQGLGFQGLRNSGISDRVEGQEYPSVHAQSLQRPTGVPMHSNNALNPKRHSSPPIRPTQLAHVHLNPIPCARHSTQASSNPSNTTCPRPLYSTHQQHPLPSLHCIGVHLNLVGAVLSDVLFRHSRAWQHAGSGGGNGGVWRLSQDEGHAKYSRIYIAECIMMLLP